MTAESIDLGYASEEQALADAVARLLRARGCGVPSAWSQELWRELGEFGVFALATPDMPGHGALAAVCEVLGNFAVEGPAAATLAVVPTLPKTERDAVVAGRALVSLGTPPAMPWGELADIFVQIDGREATLMHVRARQPVASLAREHWARVDWSAGEQLGDADAMLARYNLALGAYLVGAAGRLVETAAEHARQRRQFGRTIGDFQGVALPLAEIVTSIDAVQVLVRIAASRLDAQTAEATDFAAFARLAASRAALNAALRSHQTHGALGVTEAGPVFTLSRRIQQWALQAPSEADLRARLPIRLPLELGALLDGRAQSRLSAEARP